MKNFVQPGNVVRLALPYDRTPGQGVKVGSIFGVAANGGLATAEDEIHLVGIYDLAKVGAQAWNAGDLVYWDDDAKLATTVVAGNTLIGGAAAAAANPSATGRVRLNGSVPDRSGAITQADAVADLTENVGAIGGVNDGDLPDLDATYAARGGDTGGAADGDYQDVSTAVTGVDGQGSNAASKDDVDARLTAIANNFEEADTVIAQLAADNVALRAAVRELADKQNATLAELRQSGVIAA